MSLKSSNKTDTNVYTLEIEIGAEPFKAAVLKAYNKAKSKIALPGFRKGKAPLAMIERFYGKDVFYEDALEIAFPEAVSDAYKEAGIEPVDSPKDVNVKSIGEDGVLFEMKVTVKPEDIKVKAYKGLEAEKAEAAVTPEEVDARIEAMRERNARTITVEDRAAAKGDIAVIDFEGFVDGKAFEGGKGSNYELELGSGQFIPGFEDQIIGMKAGEEKDIDITFPENYTKDLAGKQVVFHVKVNEVKEKQTPALDDEFAKDVSEFETLKELKDDTKAKITAEREQSAKIAFENALLEKVAGDIKADIPEVMIEEQCRRFLDEFKQRLQAQGIPYDQYCKMTGMDEAKFMEDGREPAVRQVKMDLAIAAIIKAENLDVTDEEIEEKYKSMAEQYGMELDMLKKYLDAPTVRNQLLNEKAIAVVVDSAKAEKPSKAEKTEGEEEKKPAKKTAKKAAEKAE